MSPTFAPRFALLAALCLQALPGTLAKAGTPAAAADKAHVRGFDQESPEAAEEAAPLVGAQNEQKTLAQRFASVSRRRYTKQSRLELSPALGITLISPTYLAVQPALAANFYLFETLAVGVAGDVFAGQARRTLVLGGGPQQQPQFNRPTYDARLQVLWVPLYGKISWFAEAVAHFDTYLAVGAGIVGTQKSGTSLLGSVALGQHYFISPSMALRLEVRDDGFMMEPLPGVQKSLQNLLSAHVGLSFYLPADAASP
jgi:outer membrane beta-barrel protein